MNPCTIDPKVPAHRWAWVRNMPTGATFARNAAPARGLYQCACGASRIGAANQNAPIVDQLKG